MQKGCVEINYHAEYKANKRHAYTELSMFVANVFDVCTNPNLRSWKMLFKNLSICVFKCCLHVADGPNT